MRDFVHFFAGAAPVRRAIALVPVIRYSLLILAISASVAAAQDEEDDELRRGLVATYASHGFPQETATRVDRVVAFDWGRRPPDPRLREGTFTARWRGYLLAPGPGEYRFAAHAAGDVKITLLGKTILDAASDAPRWLDAAPIELPFGWHPIEIDYKSLGESARLALFWSGPQFDWEPVGERQLYHDPEDSPPVIFERGEALSAALRCGACHAAEGAPKPLPAPALDRLAGNVSRDWLAAWLTEAPAEGDGDVHRRRMPHFALTKEEASAIAAYLFAASEKAPRPSTASRSTKKPSTKKPSTKKPSTKKNDAKKDPPTAAAGEKLFLTIGCVACHQAGELGEGELFGGGDLARIAEKRPADFFDRWLIDPAAINRDHRMPVFELTQEERKSLSLYLATLGEKIAAGAVAETSDDEATIGEGRRLVNANRCGACHTLPEETKSPSSPVAALSGESNWQRACIAKPQAGKRPGYGLSDEDAAVREYWTAIGSVARPANASVDARLVLRERNCTACHQRDESPGLAPKLTEVAAAHPELAPLLPAMTPPPLISVGDKLHDQALADAVRRAGGVYRPWLEVRMPKFSLADEELDALVQYFIARDRIPPRPEVTPAPTPEPSPEVASAGARLVTSDGFGCVSCHAVGSVEAEKAPLNARGPDLSLLSRRIRHEWFERWVRNPARIVPRMEMPAVTLPVRGVLEDDLDRQLAAVWSVLNTPGFEPPPPNPVRVLRRAGLRERGEWAVIGTDVLEDRGRVFVKPLLIGLPNRHNLLFDLETNRVAGWWLGDAARQRTRGKSWYWESGGPHSHLFGETEKRSEFAVEIDGQVCEPLVVGQFQTEADSWRHTGGGVEWKQRLHFSPAKGADRIVIHITHTITPLWPTGEASKNGLRRTLAVSRVPPNARILIRLPRKNIANAGRVRLAAPASAKFDEQGALTLAPNDAGQVTLAMEYLTSRLPDTYPVEPAPLPPNPPTPLSVAPGFEAVRLPLPEEIMPTALSWTSDGALAIASLKGRVWIARDTDGDELEDHATPFSDDLAAPYGLSRSRPPDGTLPQILNRAGDRPNQPGASRSRLPDGTSPQKLNRAGDLPNQPGASRSRLPDGTSFKATNHAGDRPNQPGAPKSDPVRRSGPTVDVVNKYAVLRLFDEDGDGRAERTETLASGWGHTTDYHDWAVGLPRDEDGNYYVALPCQQDDRSEAAAHLRGAVVRLVPREPTEDDPRRFAIETVSAGHRFPMGIARSRDGELFVTDNQGNYNPFNELNHVMPGRRYGFINKLEQRQGLDPPLTPPAIDIPHPWTRSVNGICFLDTPPAAREKLGRDAFGPFEGHLVGCEMNNKMLVRMTLHRVGDVLQGAIYPLSYQAPKEGATFLGPLCAEVSPEGDLYVGSLLDSGWGGGNNIGAVVRMRPAPDKLPAGIREVRAEPDGLRVEFTRPVDRRRAAGVGNYTLSSYTRISTPAYGGDDKNRRTEKIAAAEVAEDYASVLLRLGAWREGYVYELQLKNLADDGKEFFPAEAHYTLRRAPSRKTK